MLFTVKPCLNLSDTQFIVSIAVGNKEFGHITAFLRSAVCSVVKRMFPFYCFFVAFRLLPAMACYTRQ